MRPVPARLGLPWVVQHVLASRQPGQLAKAGGAEVDKVQDLPARYLRAGPLSAKGMNLCALLFDTSFYWHFFIIVSVVDFLIMMDDICSILHALLKRIDDIADPPLLARLRDIDHRGAPVAYSASPECSV